MDLYLRCMCFHFHFVVDRRWQQSHTAALRRDANFREGNRILFLSGPMKQPGESSMEDSPMAADYALLAATPRRVTSDTSVAQATGDAPSAASGAASSTFTLRSPFSRKAEEDKPYVDVNDVDDMAGVVMVDSPQNQDGLKLIQEAEDDHSHEPDGEDDDDAELYRYVYLNAPEANAHFPSNTVITSRFTLFNFIPKLLFYEFSKLANAYFLVISVMQTIGPISNTGGFPASLPALSIIVLIDMFFACLEDYKRHQADHITNGLPCRVFDREKLTFETVTWAELHVGDIVKLQNREPVPADLVILAACEPEPENPAGICYVETKSLDGETNLKLRQGLESTYTSIRHEKDVAALEGFVVCETPNNSIHRFSGSLTLQDGNKEVITTNAIMLRGSTLRNTEYIYGLVVNTGPDTKIMRASSDNPMKWSNMEKRLNRQILYICALMIVLCLTGAIASTVWNHGNLSDVRGVQAWYLFDKNSTAVKSPTGNFMIQLLYYFLLLNSFIPVSLYVSMTSVKFMQAKFMNNDLEMYHAETDTPCRVRTMALNEELGQIDYIFTDKTGTLTCNIMEFRKCSINGVSYGLGETEVGIAAKKRREEEGAASMVITEERCDEVETDANHRHRVVMAPFVNYQDDTLFDAMNQLGSQHANTIASFFEHLAVCHTVMPEKTSEGKLRLSASSPDEQALVAAAGCFGFRFVARAPGKAMIESFSCLSPDEEVQNANVKTNAYEILEVLEFNSTRKRMSVILKAPDGTLKLLCKGADTVMYERLRNTTDPQVLHVRQQTLQHMETFANEGLRTLVIGSSIIEPAFYERWVKQYRRAINDMRQIEMRRQGEPNEIDRLMEEIEVDLDILGATAIEDRLQEAVPDTIHKLRQASIKIWMLTGDKEETAINIGFACRLLTVDVERIVISADSHPDLLSIMEELELYSVDEDEEDDSENATNQNTRLERQSSHLLRNSNHSFIGNVPEDRRRLTRIESMAMNHPKRELALVIDGETLELALEECPDLFLNVAQRCVAVIACRVSPAQKAQLVCLVRENNPEVRTLAIGDGANDVSMIQSAHVGVGISGQEGMQAANSSDYAIAQFRFLSRLLLVHGRWNYVRMGKLILYIFYKNVMMNLTQFWYMIYTGFSGQKYFLEWGLQGYNLIFTALPIILISTLEQDVPASLAHNYPLLYRIGQENSHFNTKIVWAWITSCMWESLIISFGTIYGMQYLNHTGETPNMWVYGCVAFTIVLLVVTLKLMLHQQMWWPVHFVIYFFSVSPWIVVAAVISGGKSISSAYWNGVFPNSFGIRVFWLLVPLLVFTALSRDFLWKGYQRAFRASYKHLAQEVHAFKLEPLADQLLAFPPPETIPKQDDVEAATPVVVVEPVDKKARKSVITVPTRWLPMARRGSGRRSVARGSAFSYDAESVMVESFMASERYNHDTARETRAVFDRHASRGSMAFHGLPPDAAVTMTFLSRLAASTEQQQSSASGSGVGESGNSTPGARLSQQNSAGNVFRGTRHSYGRSRFFSTSALNTEAAARTRAGRSERHHSSSDALVAGTGLGRWLRRGGSNSDAVPRRVTELLPLAASPTHRVRRFSQRSPMVQRQMSA